MFVPVNRFIDVANNVTKYFKDALQYNELSRVTNAHYAKQNVKQIFGIKNLAANQLNNRNLTPYEFRGLMEEKQKFIDSLGGVLPVDIATAVVRIMVNREYPDGPVEDQEGHKSAAKEKLRATFVLLNDEWPTVSNQITVSVASGKATAQQIALQLQQFLASNFGSTYWQIFGVESHMDWLDATKEAESEVEVERAKLAQQLFEANRMDVDKAPEEIRAWSFKQMKLPKEPPVAKIKYAKFVSEPMDQVVDETPSYRSRERVSANVAAETNLRFGPAHLASQMVVDEDDWTPMDEEGAAQDESVPMETDDGVNINHVMHARMSVNSKRTGLKRVLRETYVSSDGTVRDAPGTTLEARIAEGITRRKLSSEGTMPLRTAPSGKGVVPPATMSKKRSYVDIALSKKRDRDEFTNQSEQGTSKTARPDTSLPSKRLRGSGIGKTKAAAILRGSIKAGNNNPLLTKALSRIKQ